MAPRALFNNSRSIFMLYLLRTIELEKIAQYWLIKRGKPTLLFCRLECVCTTQEHELKTLSDKLIDLNSVKETVKVSLYNPSKNIWANVVTNFVIRLNLSNVIRSESHVDDRCIVCRNSNFIWVFVFNLFDNNNT